MQLPKRMDDNCRKVCHTPCFKEVKHLVGPWERFDDLRRHREFTLALWRLSLRLRIPAHLTEWPAPPRLRIGGDLRPRMHTLGRALSPTLRRFPSALLVPTTARSPLLWRHSCSTVHTQQKHFSSMSSSQTSDTQMTDVTSPAVVVPADAAAAPATTNSNGDTEMEIVYSCTIYGLAGWDSGVKIEKKLRDYSIPFKHVTKRKGVMEDKGTIYFHSEQEMKESMEKMQEMKEPVNQGNAAAAAAAVPATASSPEPSDASAGASSSGQFRMIFKIRAPVISSRKRRAPIPADRAPKPKEFRPAKRQKVELKEGDVGYAEAAEEAARSASEGEQSDNEGAEPPARAAPTASAGSGRISPTHMVERTINDVVAPLWRKPYAEQLVIKRNEVKELMQSTTRAWVREYGRALNLPYASEEPNAGNGKRTAQLFCTLAPIVPSPVTDAYRNKCEFTIGVNGKGEEEIGHLMGKYTEGTVTVESIQDCPHVPTIAKSLSMTLLEFVRAHRSEYKPYDKRDHSGFWRLVIVRNSTETKQAMMLIQVAEKSRTPEQMEEFRKKLKEHFDAAIVNNPEWSEKNEGYTLKAIQLQCYDGLSNAAPEGTPMSLLYGKEGSITERLMGLEFRVSQGAFFQINVPQTSKLYSLAAEFAQLPPADAPSSAKSHVTLFDVCCGTGTIGLSLANRVGKVIGLEMSSAAVEDAKENAKRNGIENAFYYVGKAEDTIKDALADHVPPIVQQKKGAAPVVEEHVVTAIVDPPRSGLHADVIRLLRRCPRIDRIVYVSCNPKTLMENIQRFIQPASKKWTGPPFTVVKAVPVDMFPHTDHCEMVVLLEREKYVAPQQKGKPQIKVFAHQLQSQPSAAATAASAGSDDVTEPTPAVIAKPENVEMHDAAATSASTSEPKQDAATAQS